MGSKKRATRKIPKGMKKCKECKMTGVCKHCDGHGISRIVKGRTKGNKFENDTAKEITKWTGVEFKRTPMSGGWAKTGDITPKNPKEMTKFPFNIECKNQEIFSTKFLVECASEGVLPKATIEKWWKQCTDDAKKSKKIPILVMTKAREPVYVMTTQTIFQKLKLMKNTTFVIRFDGLRVTLWKDFLSIPYKTIVERLGE